MLFDGRIETKLSGDYILFGLDTAGKHRLLDQPI